MVSSFRFVAILGAVIIASVLLFQGKAQSLTLHWETNHGNGTEVGDYFGSLPYMADIPLSVGGMSFYYEGDTDPYEDDFTGYAEVNVDMVPVGFPVAVKTWYTFFCFSQYDNDNNNSEYFSNANNANAPTGGEWDQITNDEYDGVIDGVS